MVPDLSHIYIVHIYLSIYERERRSTKETKPENDYKKKKKEKGKLEKPKLNAKRMFYKSNKLLNSKASEKT